MMSILIIGSKGFIGSHVYDYFTSKVEEYNCVGCDITVDYNDEKYFQIDETDFGFNEIFQQRPFDICINCSGAASVPDSVIHPLRDFNLNVHNVVKILDAIKKFSPYCKFINLSSAAVYGNPSQLPISENNPCNPVSPYGVHKQMAEKLCREYATFFGLHTCSVRIFSAYGPGLKKQLLWDIYKKTIESDAVTLFGSGNESRDFVYISDIIHAIELLILKASFNGEVYNVANGSEITIRQLAETMLNVLKYKGALVFTGQQRIGDPINWRADITKIKAEGYQPNMSIEDGIAKYVEWAREEN